MSEVRVLRSTDPQRQLLEGQGWQVVAESWAAELRMSDDTTARLRRIVSAVGIPGEVRELSADDVPAILALDRQAAADFPGDVATSHTPLTPVSATPDEDLRIVGCLDRDGELLGFTTLETSGSSAEVGVTIVAGSVRGQGIGTVIKAVALLSLAQDGVTTFRTGGAAENTAIRRANATLGFVIDEWWVTLRRA